MRKLIALCALAAPLLTGMLEAAAARDLFTWVQYGPSGPEIRAATSDGLCPTALVDGEAIPLSERASPGDAYPVRGCALPRKPGAISISVEGQAMPSPRPRPDRILIIGDTGCRLKGATAQACNNPVEWPFAAAAARAAAFAPDLVLHVGDMHYRETPCPADNAGCQGSPYGDTWETWKADFFVPAQGLLHAAPWVFVRGNHEDCFRGGKGWSRLLDPYAFDATKGAAGCLDASAPFTVDLQGVTLAVMDVAVAMEREDPAQAQVYRQQFEGMNALARPVWVALHRPLWAVEAIIKGAPVGENRTLARAARDALPPQVTTFISGHHHAFSVLSYKEDLPVQVISGHGGDELATHVPPVAEGTTINGVTVANAILRTGVFGFSMLEREADDATGLRWKLTNYDVSGRSLSVCDLSGRSFSCR